MVFEVEKIEHVKARLKLTGEMWRILGAHPKRDDGAGIAEDGMPDVGHPVDADTDGRS